MNRKEMMEDPKYLELIKTIGEEMQLRSKKEQEEKVRNFKTLNKTAIKGQILFTGSSLMEQFPIAEIAQNDRLQKIIYNRGIGGYNTDDFLAEINTVLFDLEPSKIFINIGTNDMNVRQDGSDWNQHLLTNYKKILDQIKKRLPDTKVYMMAYYPVNPTVIENEFMAEMLKIRTNDNLNMVNGQMEALAVKFGFHFIDANAGLRDDAGNLKAEFTKEGLHMYAGAYEIVYQNLKEYI